MSAVGRRVLVGLVLGATSLVVGAALFRIAGPATDAPVGIAADQAIHHEAAPSSNASSTAPTERAAPDDAASTGQTGTGSGPEGEGPGVEGRQSTLDLAGIRSLPPAAQLPTPPEREPVPVAIRIADIGIVEGPVVPVGVDAGGAYEVPAATDVGWYRFGPAPGVGGSSVLAAHIAYDGTPGVFRDLALAQPGAVVAIVMSDASTVTYEIEQVVDYLKADLPTDRLFDESGPDRLVLITCGGAFNPSIRSYESNTVAYATRVD